MNFTLRLLSPRSLAVFALLLVFLFHASCLAALEPLADKPTHHASLAAACDAAAINQSMVLLIFGAEWCGPCKMLKKNTLDSEDFTQHGGALRIYEVNIDVDEKTTRAYGVSAVPTLFLLTPESKVLARRSGYMDVKEMLKWLEQGRERMKQGQWEGIAPEGSLGGLTAKASTGTLQTNELRQLIELLARPEPAERLSAGRLLLAQREKAIPFLIDALADSYLGLRISAADLLQKLAPEAPAVDPWQSPDELREAITSLKTWWAKTGQLPPATQVRPLDPGTEASIKSALEEIRGNDPIQRTEAMSALVNAGAAALPKLREAIKAAEAKSDQRSLALLEDVFWALLISDGVERRAGHVRLALARGASPERQQAAARLGRAGREAIPPLAELVNDSDALVAENAVRALSGIGGKDSIAAMSALLKAADPNLRMTAAQALGKTKNTEAAKPLLGAVADGNEIVACTALAAVEEVFSGNSGHYSGGNDVPKVPPEIVNALKGALQDKRWRVRASAAEIAGKLHVAELSDHLKKLLDDADGFVVKNTIVALQGLNIEFTVPQLATLIKRLPSLRADALAIMLQRGTDETVKAVTEMYEKGSTEERVGILAALARGESANFENWTPLLTNTAAAPEAALRKATVAVLATRPPRDAADLVGLFLADPDPATRAEAADVVVSILAGKRKVSSRMGGMLEAFVEESGSNAGGRKSKTNQVYATKEQISSWHSKLAGLAQSNLDFRVAAALYATGDGKTDLPALTKALDSLDERTRKHLSDSPVIGVLLRQLPWPEGKPLLEKWAASPAAYAVAALDSEQARPEARAFLLEPARFKQAVESATGEELMTALQLLLNGGSPYEDEEQRKWSLFKTGEPAGSIVKELLHSTNAAWRAAALTVLGKRGKSTQSSDFENGLRDPNPWVRAVAIKGFAQVASSRTLLEERLGPFLAETNRYVAQAAAMALLEPEVRNASGLAFLFTYFYFDGKPVPTQTSYSYENDDRPLAPFNYKPAFVEHARKHFHTADKEQAPVFGLLLAQYGEFDGLAKLAGLLPEPDGSEDEEAAPEETPSSSDLVLTAISLSRDDKFVPVLRRLLEPMKTDYQVRKIIKALRGMTGPEARALRLEANKRLRQQVARSFDGGIE